MLLDEVADELGPSCKETAVNCLAKGRFGGLPSGGMKELGEGRKKGLMVGAVCLMQPKLRLERKGLTISQDWRKSQCFSHTGSFVERGCTKEKYQRLCS